MLRVRAIIFRRQSKILPKNLVIQLSKFLIFHGIPSIIKISTNLSLKYIEISEHMVIKFEILKLFYIFHLFIYIYYILNKIKVKVKLTYFSFEVRWWNNCSSLNSWFIQKIQYGASRHNGVCYLCFDRLKWQPEIIIYFMKNIIFCYTLIIIIETCWWK